MPPPPFSETSTRFLWVDGVRGIAACLVVIFHYHHFYMPYAQSYDSVPPTSEIIFGALLWPAYEYGMLAVQLFWLISGFVFAHVYFNRPTTARAFAAARFARLYPLHLATLLFVAGLQIVSQELAGHWQIYGSNDLRHFLLQLGFASNWTTLFSGLSYNGPIWSVSVEMLAYLAFFFALGLLRRAPLGVALTLSLMCWAVVWGDFELRFVRRDVFQCGGYFFAGCALYTLLSTQTRHWFALLAVALALAAAGLFLSSLNLGLVGGASAVVILAAWMDHGPWQPRRLLGFFGDISYSIYLVHVPLQMLVLLIADIAFGGTRAFAEYWITLPVYLAVSLGLAHLVHHRFERPVGHWMRARLSGRKPGA